VKCSGSLLFSRGRSVPERPRTGLQALGCGHLTVHAARFSLPGFLPLTVLWGTTGQSMALQVSTFPETWPPLAQPEAPDVESPAGRRSTAQKVKVPGLSPQAAFPEEKGEGAF
jgi:hypothetical protein